MVAVRIISIIFGALLMGALLGLIPFFFGRKKGKDTMGLVCMLLCMLGSFIAGLYLSAPICLISVIVIAVSKGNQAGNADPYAGQYSNLYPNQYTDQNTSQYSNQYIGQNTGRYSDQYTGQNTGKYPNQYYANAQQTVDPDHGQQGFHADFQYIYCPSCGKQLKPGTAYCTNCGRKL